MPAITLLSHQHHHNHHHNHLHQPDTPPLHHVSAAAPTLTEAEFAELPASIQRKYFSPLERLRIADHTAAVLARAHQLDQQPAAQHRLRRTTSVPSTLSGASSSSCHYHHHHHHHRPKRKRARLQKPESAALHDQLASHADAQWFLNLPDKVRRRHFSREEQILYAGRCDAFFLAADVVAVDESPPPPTPTPTPAPDEPALDLALDLALPQPPQTPSHRPRTALSSSSSLAASVSEQSPAPVERAVPVRFFKPQDVLMASCFDASAGKRGRRPSLSRRTLSLSGGSIRDGIRTSTSSIPPLFSPTGSSFHSHRRTASSAPRLSESSGSGIDPNAVHYQDPEARMKLRLYLGSPQKFDEAVEFGFPAGGGGGGGGDPDRRLLGARRSDDFLAPLALSHDVQTFMNDDWLSFLDDDDDEDEEDEDEEDEDEDGLDGDDEHSLPDADSPVTPGDPEDVFRPGRVASSSQGPSLDSTPSSVHVGRLHHHHHHHYNHHNHSHNHTPNKPDLLATALSGNREMTLRMTLTRPDLRASDDDVYGWQPRPQSQSQSQSHLQQPPPPQRPGADPLALEVLPVSDDTTGAHGPFAVRAQRGSAGRWGKRLLLGGFGKRERR